MEELARRTDVPFDKPPTAVEQWNRGDHGDFPESDPSTSVHPPDAILTDGAFVKDAYVDVFAIQPSTHLRASPHEHRLYVASNGSVLGTIDYRVELPPDILARDRQVRHSLLGDRVREVLLEVDGTVEATGDGTSTPTLNYTALDRYAGQSHEIELVAEIAATVRTDIRTCTDRINESTCGNWSHSVEHDTDTVTVRDTIEVVEYDLSVSGYRAQYPNGDFGVVAYNPLPWQGYSLSNGSVRGVWRFYAARNPEWDTLVRRTESGSTVIASPLRPLQVHAYPSETGPMTSPNWAVTLLDTAGTERAPPRLSENVHLDVVDGPYVSSHSVAARTAGAGRLSDVTVHGVVRGVSADARNASFLEVPINESDLTLRVTNRTDETVTVEVDLRDRQTGDPIATDERDGCVVLDGKRVNTSGDGTATRTLARTAGGVSARYEPGHWWADSPGYVGDSDTAYVRGAGLPIRSVVYHVGVLGALYLFGVVVIGRVTGWRLWPPWRNL